VTIAACYLSTEGVVLGADSTTTVPGGTNGPHYFNHNQKLYEVGADSTLGIVTWGLGTLFTTSHRTIIAQFADGLRSNPAATVAEAADRWGQIFWTAYTASGISTALADLFWR
jgi:hypothetical protein